MSDSSNAIPDPPDNGYRMVLSCLRKKEQSELAIASAIASEVLDSKYLALLNHGSSSAPTSFLTPPSVSKPCTTLPPTTSPELAKTNVQPLMTSKPDQPSLNRYPQGNL